MTTPTLPTLADIQDAARVIRDAVARTPSVPALALSAAVGVEIVLKLETQQRTGSFKERGAFYKLASLSAEERARGVIAMSAGNHAQGVAYHAQRQGIPATIVMPQGTPFTKIERTAGYGARVVLRGDSLTEARAAAYEIAAAEQLVFVHPYDDLHVIAGQGTIALEMLADHPDLDVLVAPIGGGGMIGGMAIAAKALKPSIRIVGVQTESFPSMLHALKGLPAPVPTQTLAEGIAVKEPGVMTEAIARRFVDEIVLVDEDRLERAVEMLLLHQKLVAEGAGAAGIAALLLDPEQYKGRKVGVVLCGGNIDARILSSILMRGMVRNGRLVRLRSEIPDSPGTLAKVARIIGEAGGNIVEIFHQRLFHDVPVKFTDLDVVIETRDLVHVREIMGQLDNAGFKTRLLSSSTLEGGI